MKLKTLWPVLETKGIVIVAGDKNVRIDGSGMKDVALSTYGNRTVKMVCAGYDMLKIEVEEEQKHERGAGKDPLWKADTHIKEKVRDPLHECDVDGAHMEPYTGVPF